MLRRMPELYERHGQPLHLVFLDWAKACDTISHLAIRHPLVRMGVPEPLMQAITSLHKNPRYKVRDNLSTSAAFPQQRGVCQGCPLSTYLFVILLSVVMHNSDTEYERMHGMLPWVFLPSTPCWGLEYADDTLLVTRGTESTERLLHLLEYHVARVGL